MLCRTRQPVFYRLGKFLSTNAQEFFVLGIETSCDDTGAAIVSSKGDILSNERESQLQTHLLSGGIVPCVAGELHQQNIEKVVNRAIESAGVPPSDIEAIAVTQGPGLALSLRVGIEHALELAKTLKKPVIPVHHMEAHALTARLMFPIAFPFLVLLASGGHCILAVCEAFGRFYRLGETLDDSPGEAFDKVSRILRLHFHPLGKGLSGGAAIEGVARLGDPLVHPLPRIMATRLDCNFSFSGIKSSVKRCVDKLDVNSFQDSVSFQDSSSFQTSNTSQDLDSYQNSPVPGSENIAASFQSTVCTHLANRTERGILYCKQRWPNLSQLVVSGGVASNSVLRMELKRVVDKHGYNLYAPPPSLCTDNGAMIAWAGVEHIKAGKDYKALDNLYFHPRWKLGEDISTLVTSQKLRVKDPPMRLYSVQHCTDDE